MFKQRKPILFLFLLVLTGVLLVLAYFYTRKTEHKDFIILYGNVDVRQVDLGFRVSGRVETMPFQEGDFVRKGTLAASLEVTPYNDQVAQAKANVESMRFILANAELLFLRRQELVKQGAVSKEDFDNSMAARDVAASNLIEVEAALQVAETNLRETKVYCPNDGTILTRIREPGTVVNPADPVYTVSLISPVWIRVFIPEEYLGVVYPGMRAEVFTDTKGGPTYTAQVGFISPVAEFTPKTVETTELRTDLVYRLRIIADNPDWGLRQGMPVTVKLYKKPLEKVQEILHHASFWEYKDQPAKPAKIKKPIFKFFRGP